MSTITLEGMSNDRELNSLSPSEYISVFNKIRRHNLKENQLAHQSISLIKFLKKPADIFNNFSVTKAPELIQFIWLILILILFIFFVIFLILLVIFNIGSSLSDYDFTENIKLTEKCIFINILIILSLFVLVYFINYLIMSFSELYYNYISYKNSENI